MQGLGLLVGLVPEWMKEQFDTERKQDNQTGRTSLFTAGKNA